MGFISDIDLVTSEVASAIIFAARNSGNDPIAWVTGNSMMPPARNFSVMEEIWQADYNRTEPVFDWVWEEVERKVEEANVYLACPDYDNALYAVDTARFEFIPGDFYAESLQDEWRPIEEWEMYDSE